MADGAIGGVITPTVSTIAALKAVAPSSDTTLYFVRGYLAAGDGGAGTYRWNASDTSTDDGGMIIAPNVGGTGRWNLVHNGVVSCANYGMLPDGVTDWFAGFGNRFYTMLKNAALGGWTIKFPSGLYATGFSLDNSYANLRMHSDEGAEFGSVIHLISSAIPTTIFISTIARASNVVTVTTTAPHGRNTGDTISIRNVTGGTTNFNGDAFTIIVTGASSFTYAQTGADESGTVNGNSAVGDKPLIGLRLTGTWTSYDRFGCIYAKDTYVQRVRVKSDTTKHTVFPGTKSRGVHIYAGTDDFRCDEIIVDDCGTANSTYAAVAIDGAGANPMNLRIGRIWVKASDCHGVYLTGGRHTIGEIRVDEFCQSAVLTQTLEDSDSNAQSIEGKGVWINRCWDTSIGSCIVNQSNFGTRTCAKYHFLLDETGLTNLPFSTFTPVVIDTLLIRNAKVGSCSIVDGTYRSPEVNSRIGLLEVQGATGNTITSELLSCFGGTTRSRVHIDTVRFVDSNLFDCMKVYQDARVTARVVEAEQFHGRLISVVGVASHPAIVAIEKIFGTWTGGSATNPVLEFNTTSDCWIGDIEAHGGQASTPLLYVISCDRMKFGKVYGDQFRNATATVKLDTVTKSNIDALYLASTATVGVGLGVKDITDVSINNAMITLYAKGSTLLSGAATRCSSYNCVCTGNTTNTDVPNGTFTNTGSSSAFTL